ATTTATVTPHDQLPPLFQDTVKSADAAPISGGTLLVTADGTTAVAADADRNSVFLVDLAARSVRTVATTPGEQLGRVVEGPTGTVFVAARRGGAVLAVDLASATIRARTPVCNAPRGMAYDATTNTLHVACRSGNLVTLDGTSGTLVSKVTLDTDLRDVFLLGGNRYVTRFRSAEILRVDSAGTVAARTTPPSIGNNSAGVAFRGVPLPGGLFLLSHEVESSIPLGTGVDAHYGGGCVGGVVQQVLTLMSLDGTTLPAANSSTTLTTSTAGGFAMASSIVANAVGPIDLAVSRDGTRVAVVGSGNSWSVKSDLPNLFLDTLDVSTGGPPVSFGGNACGGAQAVQHHQPGEPVAVTFDAAGKYVIQSREPAMLELEGDVFIPLATDSHFDTGFAMFHMNSGTGISCASCHPEGGDDGHTWVFSEVGMRRSQALEGKVGSRAPFHWSGDLTTFEDLFSEVMIKRMALPVVPPNEDVGALKSWLDTIPALAPADDLDPALVERGRTLFSDPDVACINCHAGPEYTDNELHDVGTSGTFVTPGLLGVGLRAPLMHDGCARTLRDRFGLCGGADHGGTAGLAGADIDALVAFMRSL
ncbi:MAG TPA: cytochrome-c peroxidase, partial [Polyangiaceae bacterium]|nr:cytochrome-c peroxidase [Polyangiaceae bacterium]